MTPHTQKLLVHLQYAMKFKIKLYKTVTVILQHIDTQYNIITDIVNSYIVSAYYTGKLCTTTRHVVTTLGINSVQAM